MSKLIKKRKKENIPILSMYFKVQNIQKENEGMKNNKARFLFQQLYIYKVDWTSNFLGNYLFFFIRICVKNIKNLR